jgi:glucosyl-3-phosphoglycerate phosphatase
VAFPDSPDALIPVVRSGVLLVRHGQTTWNANQRWQGWADVALSEIGEAQAEAGAAVLASALADVPVHVVSSDLIRARATADAISLALSVEVSSVLPDLRERHIGDWSGKTTDEINEMWPGQLEAWRDGQLDSTPNGEREDVLLNRTSGALQSLAELARTELCVVIAVTHGGVMRTLTREFGGPPRAIGNLDGCWFALAGDQLEHRGDVHLLTHSRIVVEGAGGTAL